MKIPFYLLGLLLRNGSQHGYSLKQIVETRIADFAKIKLPTIYYHLDKLHQKGYVTKALDREGSRPEKYVYSITDEGKAQFHTLLERQLHTDDTLEFSLDGVLYFGEHVEDTELLSELRQRKDTLAHKLAALRAHKDQVLATVHPKGRRSSEAIFNHHIVHMEAELTWLNETLKGFTP